MKSLQIILVAMLGLMLFANAMRLRPHTCKARTTVGPQLMKLSKNLTRMQRLSLADNCKGIGMKCRIAEECCTLQCVMESQRCIDYIAPNDIPAKNIYGE
ncbi:uncharacterized protein LOC115483214 [Drosophila hydei]|uniref:Uncharacterized protein LOC115483214 n=1 Tax=Drosophila hydei TaxID=7224 RepID=A0A6J2SW03_DROHY|nr:uncharacterized protein LOC115483214 [Drosophila hydei]